MHWDRFFEDLEDQLDSEWEAERAALDTEAARLRMARLTLRQRLATLCHAPGDASPAIELAGGGVLVGRLAGLGADWLAVTVPGQPAGSVLVPLAAIVAVGTPHADLLRSARGDAPVSHLSDRMTLGFVLRGLVRRRVPVTVHTTTGRSLSGTIDRAAADHVDLALHDAGEPRRSDAVTGYRIVPFGAIASVRLDADTALV